MLTELNSFFALRRSGHHAVLGWLRAGHQAGRRTAAHVNAAYNEHVAAAVPGRAPRSLDAEAILREAGPAEVLVVNIEDLSYNQRHRAPAYADARWDELGVARRDVVVVRDWYNTLASRTQKIENARCRGHTSVCAALDGDALVAAWYEHAAGLTGDALTGDRATYVDFNRWATDRPYRRELAARFDVADVEDAARAVSGFGYGSSFDERRYDGSAYMMNVTRRWLDLAPHLRARYVRTIRATPPWVDELNRRIFGFDAEEVLSDMQAMT